MKKDKERWSMKKSTKNEEENFFAISVLYQTLLTSHLDAVISTVKSVLKLVVETCRKKRRKEGERVVEEVRLSTWHLYTRWASNQTITFERQLSRNYNQGVFTGHLTEPSSGSRNPQTLDGHCVNAVILPVLMLSMKDTMFVWETTGAWMDVNDFHPAHYQWVIFRAMLFKWDHDCLPNVIKPQNYSLTPWLCLSVASERDSQTDKGEVFRAST